MKAISPSRGGVQSRLIPLLLIASMSMLAQANDWRSAIQNTLESQYALTKASADRSTVVTPGAVLVLRKDDLVMYTTTFTIPPGNTYKDGRITQSFFGRFGKVASDASTSRTFVRGEKFWVTKIEVNEDGVVFQFLSDPFDDVRYAGTLRFPYAKGTAPQPDRLTQTIAQVIQVDDSAGPPPVAGNGPAAPPPAPAQGAEAPLAPIPPPPPPADRAPVQTKSIDLGQTKEQVIAILGKPDKSFRIGTKEIYQYKDVKVTFVNGKVKDAQ